MTLAVEADGREITTIEGLMKGEELGATQQAFAEEDAFQCGYCTPGQVMAAEGLLTVEPVRRRSTRSARACPATSAGAVRTPISSGPSRRPPT